MVDDIAQLLWEAAPTPHGNPPPVAGIWRRGRRRRVQRGAIGAASAAACVGVLAGVLSASAGSPASVQLARPPLGATHVPPLSPGVPETAAAESPTAAPLPPGSAAGSGWAAAPAGPLDQQGSPVTAWTGNEYLLWGGDVGVELPHARALGASYDPVRRTWTTLTTAPLEIGPSSTGAWTGDELIVCCGATQRAAPQAAAYDPAGDRWRLLPSPPMTEADYPISAWTGGELLVLEGRPHRTTPPNAAYDPASRSWRQLAGTPVPLGPDAAAVWAEHEMIVWPSEGGQGVTYDPGADAWSPLPPAPEGVNPVRASAVWTGQEFLVLGAQKDDETRLVGAAYAPAERTWRNLDVPLLATPSFEGNDGSQAAVWSGDRLVLLAGHFGSGPLEDYGVALSYDPDSDRWDPLPDTPSSMYRPNIVAAGENVLVHAPRRALLTLTASSAVLGAVTLEPPPTPAAQATEQRPQEQPSEVGVPEEFVTEETYQAVAAAVLRTAPVPVDIIPPDPGSRPLPDALLLRARDGSGVVQVILQSRRDGQPPVYFELSPGINTRLERPDERTEIVVHDSGEGRPQQVIAFHNLLMVNMILDRRVPGAEGGTAVSGPILRQWVDAVLADPAVEAASRVPLPDLPPALPAPG